MPETLLTLFVGKKNLDTEVATVFCESDSMWNIPVRIALPHVYIRVPLSGCVTITAKIRVCCKHELEAIG